MPGFEWVFGPTLALSGGCVGLYCASTATSAGETAAVSTASSSVRHGVEAVASQPQRRALQHSLCPTTDDASAMASVSRSEPATPPSESPRAADSEEDPLAAEPERGRHILAPSGPPGLRVAEETPAAHDNTTLHAVAAAQEGEDAQNPPHEEAPTQTVETSEGELQLSCAWAASNYDVADSTELPPRIEEESAVEETPVTIEESEVITQEAPPEEEMVLEEADGGDEDEQRETVRAEEEVLLPPIESESTTVKGGDLYSVGVAWTEDLTACRRDVAVTLAVQGADAVVVAEGQPEGAGQGGGGVRVWVLGSNELAADYKLDEHDIEMISPDSVGLLTANREEESEWTEVPKRGNARV